MTKRRQSSRYNASDDEYRHEGSEQEEFVKTPRRSLKATRISLPGTVEIVGDLENQTATFLKYYHAGVTGMVTAPKGGITDYEKTFKLPSKHRALRRQKQEEVELLFDEYFQRSMAKRVNKKRKRNKDDDTADEIDELVSELQMQAGPITNPDILPECISKSDVTPQDDSMHQLFAIWNIRWNDTHTCAKKVGEKTHSNLLIGGFGSKIDLITMFVAQYIDAPATCAIIVAAAYDPTITVRDILIRSLGSLNPKFSVSNHDTDTFLVSEIHDKLTERVKGAADTLNPDFFLHALQPNSTERRAPKQSELYICIHGLDSPQLQNQHSQRILAQLASHPQVHLIASIDRPYSTLMWDVALYSDFQFQYFWVEEGVGAYIYESLLNDRFAESVKEAVVQSKDNILKGAEHILRSFGNTHVRTFATVVAMIKSGTEDDPDADSYSLEDIHKQLEQQTNKAAFLNMRTIKDHLKKMVDNGLLETKVSSGKQIYFLAKQYMKILPSLYELTRDMSGGDKAKMQKR